MIKIGFNLIVLIQLVKKSWRKQINVCKVSASLLMYYISKDASLWLKVYDWKEKLMFLQCPLGIPGTASYGTGSGGYYMMWSPHICHLLLIHHLCCICMWYWQHGLLDKKVGLTWFLFTLWTGLGVFFVVVGVCFGFCGLWFFWLVRDFCLLFGFLLVCCCCCCCVVCFGFFKQIQCAKRTNVCSMLELSVLKWAVW